MSYCWIRPLLEFSNVDIRLVQIRWLLVKKSARNIFHTNNLKASNGIKIYTSLRKKWGWDYGSQNEPLKTTLSFESSKCCHVNGSKECYRLSHHIIRRLERMCQRRHAVDSRWEQVCYNRLQIATGNVPLETTLLMLLMGLALHFIESVYFIYNSNEGHG